MLIRTTSLSHSAKPERRFKKTSTPSRLYHLLPFNAYHFLAIASNRYHPKRTKYGHFPQKACRLRCKALITRHNAFHEKTKEYFQSREYVRFRARQRGFVARSRFVCVQFDGSCVGLFLRPVLWQGSLHLEKAQKRKKAARCMCSDYGFAAYSWRCRLWWRCLREQHFRQAACERNGRADQCTFRRRDSSRRAVLYAHLRRGPL